MPLTELFLVDSQTISVGLQKISNTSLAGFKIKLQFEDKIKFETEKYKSTKNKTLDQLKKKTNGG